MAMAINLMSMDMLMKKCNMMKLGSGTSFFPLSRGRKGKTRNYMG